jgi:metallo-beta-lactamase class B
MKRELVMLLCLPLLASGIFLGAQDKIVLREDVEILPLAPGVWQHITYQKMEKWGMVPANGLVVVDDGHAALIDTPWTPEQTALLLDWVERELKAKAEIAIVGHSHVDCLGGLHEVHRRGMRSIGLERTRELALKAGVEAPKETFVGSTRLAVGGLELELFHPGAGHTVDNIVTWIPGKKVLFGGCFVKPVDARSLGNIEESDLAAWPASLANLKKRFSDAKIIVPGHGDAGGWELVENTLRLLSAGKK